MELVDQLRLTIPEEIRTAEDVLSQKDQILNTAANDARRTKSMAEDELRDRLNNNEWSLKQKPEQLKLSETQKSESREC